MVRVLYVLAAVMAVGFASCTPPPPPITFIKSGSYVENKGHASALSGNSEQAYSTPSYSGSNGVSGSYVTTGTDSYGLAKGYSQAATDDYKGATVSDLFSFAAMANDHLVPSSDTATKYLSVADSGLPYSASAGRDVVLNTPHSAGAIAEAGASTAASNRCLACEGQKQGISVKLPDAFPAELVTDEQDAVSIYGVLGRKLLSGPGSLAFTLAGGQSKGYSGVGGTIAASFDSPFASASLSDSLDFQAAESSATTSSRFTDADTGTFAFGNQAGAQLSASSLGPGGWDISVGRDVSIVTPYFAGANAKSQSGSAHSEQGLSSVLQKTEGLVQRFPILNIPEIVGKPAPIPPRPPTGGGRATLTG